MPYQSWMATLAYQRAAGPANNNYTTAKTCINPDALWTAPPNYFYVGQRLRVRASGSISNIVTTPGLINFQVKIGSVAAFDTGTMQMNATAHTTLPFWLDIEMTIRSVGSGSAATLIGQSIFTYKGITFTAAQTDDAQDMPTLLAPATAPAAGTGFDSTIANIVDFWCGFTIAASGNQIQVQQYGLEGLS